MANYANLLATIAANIYTNGNNEVTASMVKTAVDAMVASLGAGYQFMGVAAENGTPGTPDYNCYWLAGPGTYANYGGLVVDAGHVAVLTYDGSWTKTDTPMIGMLNSNVSPTLVTQYAVISAAFNIVQNGNGSSVYVCDVSPFKRYRVTYNPIVNAGAGSYFWVFTRGTISVNSRRSSSDFKASPQPSNPQTIEIAAPYAATKLYIMSNSTPVVSEFEDVAVNNTDSLSSTSEDFALSADAGRRANQNAFQRTSAISDHNVVNGRPVVYADINNWPDMVYVADKDYEHNCLEFRINANGANWTPSVVFVPTGRNLVHIRFRVEITRDGNNDNLVVYVGQTASAGDGYYALQTIAADGYYDITFDPAHYTVYDGWTTFCVWLANAGALSSGQTFSAKFYDLQVVEFDGKANFSVLSGETLRDVLMSADTAINENSGSESSNVIISPDGTKYAIAVANDGTIISIPVVPDKAVIFGNSLVGGFSIVGGGSFGMCASSPQDDFVSKFFAACTALNAGFNGTKVGAAAFEVLSDVSQIDSAIATYFAPYLSGNEDLVVVELGDNVSEANAPVFRVSSERLLRFIRSTCPRARVVWCGVWYGKTSVYNAIRNACDVTGSMFVTIADLVTSANRGRIGNTIKQGSSTWTINNVTDVVENAVGNITVTFMVDGLSYSATMDVASYSLAGTTLTYTGEYSVVQLAGVASHPGNAGMTAIANRLLESLSIS